MNRDYVSEFTLFIDQYLEQHPEVVEAQRCGWDFGWHTAWFDPQAAREAAEDSVPDDLYGFNLHVRHNKPDPPASH
jgi:hypothetical protein